MDRRNRWIVANVATSTRDRSGAGAPWPSALALGLGGGLWVASVACTTLWANAGSAQPAAFDERLWRMLLASGSAAIAGMAILGVTAQFAGTARLGAAFFHAYHIHLGRLVALFALLHAGLLVAMEPHLLLDLRPGASLSVPAGAAALLLLLVLAGVPAREARGIRARPLRSALHVLLAASAALLALVHVLARDYDGNEARHWFFAALIGVTLVVSVRRGLARRSAPAAVFTTSSGGPLRTLAFRAILVTGVCVVALVSLFGLSG